MVKLINKKYLFLLAVASFIISVDQATKNFIHTTYELGESHPVIQGFFNITYVRNEGAAFGFLNEAGFRHTFFLIVPVIAMITLLFMLHGAKNNDRLQILALSSIFGGALGNYIDRLNLGFVVDFLDFHWQRAYTFAAFNVADMAIVGGVGLLLILTYFETVNERKAQKANRKS